MAQPSGRGARWRMHHWLSAAGRAVWVLLCCLAWRPLCSEHGGVPGTFAESWRRFTKNIKVLVAASITVAWVLVEEGKRQRAGFAVNSHQPARRPPIELFD